MNRDWKTEDLIDPNWRERVPGEDDDRDDDEEEAGLVPLGEMLAAMQADLAKRKEVDRGRVNRVADLISRKSRAR